MRARALLWQAAVERWLPPIQVFPPVQVCPRLSVSPSLSLPHPALSQAFSPSYAGVCARTSRHEPELARCQHKRFVTVRSFETFLRGYSEAAIDLNALQVFVLHAVGGNESECISLFHGSF